jgi:hypothetical protein
MSPPTYKRRYDYRDDKDRDYKKKGGKTKRRGGKRDDKKRKGGKTKRRRMSW